MSFAKNVNKYSKWVLGGVVALLAVALVVPNTIGSGEDSATKAHATIFGTVTVTEREWQEAYAKSGAWYRLQVVRLVDEGSDYELQQIGPYLFEFKGGPGFLVFHEKFKPSQEDRLAAARELIILGYDARAKQVRASEEEVEEIIRGFLARAKIDAEDAEKHAEFSRLYFLADNESFKAAVRDSILIEKALSLDVGGCNVRYEDIFIDKLSSSRSMRVMVAGIDGAKVPGDLVPVTDDEIRAQFELQRENFKMPAKVQVEYLMASFEDFKSRIKDPTPEEIQKYYDANQKQFPEQPAGLEPGHREDDGHDHPPATMKYKPIEQVREEIIKKIKETLASNEAWKTIKEVSSTDFAGRWYKLLEEEKAREPKDPRSVQERALARTGPILAELRDKYKERGINLVNGITLPFEKNEREALEKELGKATGGDPVDRAFQAPVGEVANQVYRSDKGLALIRVANKIEGYETDLTGPVREKIRRDLLNGRVAQRAQRLADEIVTRLRSNGAAELARLKQRSDVTFQRSTYFSQATPDAETGLSPAGLVQQAKSKLLKPAPEPVTPGGIEAQAVYGDLVGGDRKEWAFVVIVEDTVQVAPEVKDQEFLADVRRHEAEEMSKARSAQSSRLVKNAEWKEAAAAPPPAE